MASADFTFGIEIETTMPAGSVMVGGHGNGFQVPWLPAGWLADGDPSIIAPSGRVGCEFVSPILRGAEGIRQLMAVIAEIKSRGGQVNPSCGLHVHVGFDLSNTMSVYRLISLVSNHERGLYAITGTHRREAGQGSRYSTCWCKGLRQYGKVEDAERYAKGDRYHILNLQTYKPTVEFRVFGGSLNPVKAAAYVMVCIGLCDRACSTKRSATWMPKTRAANAASRKQGQWEAMRLMESLGWRKNGTATQPLRVIDGEGVPAVGSLVKELNRLAKKYDGE
jgi:hypothetical protein